MKDAEVVRELISCVPSEVSGDPPLVPIEMFDAIEREHDIEALTLDLLSRAIYVREG